MTFRLLHVCTGNICRSPMAERLTRAGLAARAVGDGSVVESAGTWGLAAGRRGAAPPADPRDDDLADPDRATASAFTACAELVEHCLRRPLDLVAGPVAG